MSSASNCGCSHAAKWPPRGKLDQCTTFSARSAQLRGGMGNSFGRWTMPQGGLILSTSLQVKGMFARFAVEANRGMSGAGEPVQHDIGDHLILRERFVRLRTTVAPAAKLLDVPGRQAGGGVRERIAQGQWLRSLYREVRAFGVGPFRNPG